MIGFEWIDGWLVLTRLFWIYVGLLRLGFIMSLRDGMFVISRGGVFFLSTMAIHWIMLLKYKRSGTV